MLLRHQARSSLHICNAALWVYFSAVMFIGLVGSVRLVGQWKPSEEVFHFLARFATEGQPTELGTDPLEGNAFGNITLSKESALWLTGRSQMSIVPTTASSTPGSNKSVNMVLASRDYLHPFRLVLVDQDHFLDIYKYRKSSNACSVMLNRISHYAFDSSCNEKGYIDIFRSVPCTSGEICPDELASNLVPGYQFRYRFRDPNQPRLWYLALVACNRSPQPTCSWQSPINSSSPQQMAYFDTMTVEYDIWLINGDPSWHNGPPSSMSHLVFLARYQFSFELRDTLLLRLFSLMSFLVVAILTFFLSKHFLCRLLQATAILYTVGLFFSTVSVLVYAYDGQGLPGVMILGDTLLSVGQCCFILAILLLAHGWPVSWRVLHEPGGLFFFWFGITILTVCATVWLHSTAFGLTVISSGLMAPEWTTPPGFCLIILRFVALSGFLLGLRKTVLAEHSTIRLKFYHHFAAASLLWFSAWPILVTVASSFVSPMERHRTLLAYAIAIDLTACSILLRQFWLSSNTRPGRHPIINLSPPPLPRAGSGSSTFLFWDYTLIAWAWISDQIQSLRGLHSRTATGRVPLMGTLERVASSDYSAVEQDPVEMDYFSRAQLT